MLEINVWLPGLTCNSSPQCPYCFACKEGMSPFSIKTENVREWGEGLVELASKYSPSFFHVGGTAEPLTCDPFILSCLAEIGKSNWVRIVTNLVAEEKVFEPFIESHLSLGVSFHPYHWGILDDHGVSVFCEKINRLKSQYGIHFACIVIVAYPPLLPIIPHQAEFIMEQTSVSVIVSRFIGNYMAAKYPSSYTDDDLSLIAATSQRGFYDHSFNHLFGGLTLENNLGGNPAFTGVTKGRGCWGGRKFIHVQPSGEIFPCPVQLDASHKIGDIFHVGDFELLEKPNICTADYCPCPDYTRYLEKNPYE